MGRKKTNLFQVNGSPMPVPDADVMITYRNIDSGASGIDQGGYDHPIFQRKMLGTWTFSYSSITLDDMEYLESIFPDDPEFQFAHPDRKHPGTLVTSICKREDLSHSWHNGLKMIWRNVKFCIVEC